MLITIFASDRSPNGKRVEIPWSTFCELVRTEPPKPRETPKRELPMWSFATFTGDYRERANVESAHCLALDVDVAPVPDEASLRAALGGLSTLYHSSSSSRPDAPRWRVVIELSRPVTAAEYDRLWLGATHLLPFPTGLQAKDPSRAWYQPRIPDEGDFVSGVISGVPLDVDAVLASTPEAQPSTISGQSPALPARPPADAPAARRKAMASALGSAWPEKGRHEAQLALAGALRSEGWSEDEALEFLCDVTRAAGHEDRTKRMATIRHTYDRTDGQALTGWTRLKSHVDPVVVDVARWGLRRDAGTDEELHRRLAELAARYETANNDGSDGGPLKFDVGGLDAPLPPIKYLVGKLIGREEVVMFVAHGNSLKTWLAFSIGLAIASGRPWLGHYMAERGRVAILDYESGKYEVTRRLKMLGAVDAELGGRLLRKSYPALDLCDHEAWITLATYKLDLLIIDSFNAASPNTDENDARAALMLQHAGRFAEATGCTVIIIHHARKGEGGDEREPLRGSTAIYGACDRVYRFGDLEKKDGGLVLTTLRSIKDGAGDPVPAIRVELSNAGLRFVEEVKAASGDKDADCDESAIRAKAIELLSKGDMQRQNLLTLLRGKTETRRRVVAELEESGAVTDYKDRRKVMLSLVRQPLVKAAG